MTVIASRPKLKTGFKNGRTIGPLHTSGPVAITPDGTKIVTCVAEEVLLTKVSDSTEICRFSGDTQHITSLCVSPSSKYLLVFTSSHSLRIYEIPTSSDPLEKHVPPIRVVSRAHDAPVHVCKADPTSTYLASGSADGVVKVWDIVRGYVTHVFKGHGGVVSALAFNYPQDPSSLQQDRKMQLVTASVDTRIRIFDLSAAATRAAGGLKPEAVLEGHHSVPRALDISSDGKWLISGGRDSVVLIWDLSSSPAASKTKSGKGKGKAYSPTVTKTIPILERVEAVGLIHPDEDLAGSTSVPDKIRFYTGGEKGVIKIWDAREGTVLFTLGKEETKISDDQEQQRQIVDAIYLPETSTVISVHADQNILFHSLSSQCLTRQLIGFNDEIVDVAFLSPHISQSTSAHPGTDTHIGVATNSSLIRVYSTSNLDARLLPGHTEIVLCLDSSAGGGVLASGSKDKSARLWAPIKSKIGHVEWGFGCVAICEGHAESVGAVAMSRTVGSDTDGEAEDGHLGFMFTGSQDRTIKMWDLSEVPLVCGGGEVDEVKKCKSLTTHKAHDKDINSLDVSPNDRFLASGSQDRTAKIYEIEYIRGSRGKSARGGVKLVGTCKGHKRGVWTVRFGRTERVLATGSGDKTVKLWSLDDFSCVKTFEGHTNSVLRVDFLNAGIQMVSAASDGLVKLWNVREEECVATLDNHEDKVWALVVSADEKTIVSGAADSVVTFWEDCTEEEEREKENKRADLVLKEQDFLNYLSLNDYRKAIELALAMEQPGRLLSLFKDIRSSVYSETSSITGHASVDEVIRTLAWSDLARLLRYVRDWNTHAKTSGVAQGVLYAVMKLRSADDVSKAFGDDAGLEAMVEGPEKLGGNVGGTALKELVDALIPYTERHLLRMERLVQESYVVDFILAEMDDGMFSGEEDAKAMDVDSILV